LHASFSDLQWVVDAGLNILFLVSAGSALSFTLVRSRDVLRRGVDY
jgi:hypothetical protein